MIKKSLIALSLLSTVSYASPPYVMNPHSSFNNDPLGWVTRMFRYGACHNVEPPLVLFTEGDMGNAVGEYWIEIKRINIETTNEYHHPDIVLVHELVHHCQVSLDGKSGDRTPREVEAHLYDILYACQVVYGKGDKCKYHRYISKKILESVYNYTGPIDIEIGLAP